MDKARRKPAVRWVLVDEETGDVAKGTWLSAAELYGMCKDNPMSTTAQQDAARIAELEAENAALRKCVEAADELRPLLGMAPERTCDNFPIEKNIKFNTAYRAFLAARAKVKP